MIKYELEGSMRHWKFKKKYSIELLRPDSFQISFKDI